MIDTTSAIAQLKSIKWLAHAGMVHSFPCKLAVERVPSWSGALCIRGQPSTSDSFGEGRSILTRHLSKHHRKEYRNWNSIVAQVNYALEQEILPSVNSVIDRIAELERVESGFALAKLSVKWDLVHFLMECAFSDLVPFGFYNEVLAVYGAGHFPCNWDEVWPNGRIWIH